MSMIYFKRIKSYESSFKLTLFNAHRLFAILTLIAAKVTEDRVISNRYWGHVCGISLFEINALEKELCMSSAFDFVVHGSDLANVYAEYQLDSFETMSIVTSRTNASTLPSMNMTLATSITNEHNPV